MSCHKFCHSTQRSRNTAVGEIEFRPAWLKNIVNLMMNLVKRMILMPSNHRTKAEESTIADEKYSVQPQ